MKKKIEIILIMLLFCIFYVLFIVYPIFISKIAVASSFGIRSRSHQCLGIVVSDEIALQVFPRGEFGFRFLGKRYTYILSDNRMHCDVCIGQDIWYGE